jgi:hypothetical protein
MIVSCSRPGVLSASPSSATALVARHGPAGPDSRPAPDAAHLCSPRRLTQCRCAIAAFACPRRVVERPRDPPDGRGSARLAVGGALASTPGSEAIGDRGKWTAIGAKAEAAADLLRYGRAWPHKRDSGAVASATRASRIAERSMSASVIWQFREIDTAMARRWPAYDRRIFHHQKASVTVRPSLYHSCVEALTKHVPGATVTSCGMRPTNKEATGATLAVRVLSCTSLCRPHLKRRS